MKIWILLIMFTLGLSKIHAQTYTQTVRGWIKDKESQRPLAGVQVSVYGNHLTVYSDSSGEYRMEQVPIGRITLRFSLTGYREFLLPDILVNSAKESVFPVEMEIDVEELQATRVRGKKNVGGPANEFVLSSGRGFTIDQTNRFAGSLGDPSRMAANFAGVSGGGNDQRNDIVIRGNSGLGLLWRLEGLDIPNPNHFSNQGANGGPVSMLNNNILANSDFITGAFPAEYGNATAGVFDLKMRNGNNQKREYQGQMSFAGVEMLAEGPFQKGKGSYLISYRYSTLDFFDKVGIKFGESGLPRYQDLTWKFHFPLKKNGQLSLFGVWGKSGTTLYDSRLHDTVFVKKNYPADVDFNSQMGVAGISYSYSINKNSYFKMMAAGTMEGNQVIQDTLNSTKSKFRVYERNTFLQRITSHAFYNVRFSGRHSLRIGIQYHTQIPDFKENVYLGSYKQWREIMGADTFTHQQQAYLNYNLKINSKWTVNAGLAWLRLGLNSSNAIDPRLSVRFQANSRSTYTLGSGIHSQTQPLLVYYQKTYLQPPPQQEWWFSNLNIGLQKNAHGIIGWEQRINAHTRLKTEIYMQYAWGIGVTQRSSYLSLANLGADFGFPNVDSLDADGNTRNKGIEFTLERFFHQGFYYLLTTSLYRSEYKASDQIWRSTINDGKFIINALGGKEWKKNNQIISASFKVTWAGGKMYTPILEIESQKEGKPIYNLSEINSQQHKSYFRFDLRIGYKKNSKKFTQEWAIDIQNVLNTQNIMGQYFDPKSGKIKYNYQLGLFPVPLYRIQF